jgi:uncharacterized protein (TIGR02217 family)
MSFNEARLSDRVALGFQSIPTYNTRVVPLDNGKEARNVNWTRAKRRYTALYANFKPAVFAELLAAFHVSRGSAYPFRMKDWMDFEAVLSSLGNTPGSNSDPVQLRKDYVFGVETVSRIITKPNAGTIVVYQDNGSGTFVAKPGTTDLTTGLFTPSTAWTAGRALKASFEFDVPVRFASDEMPSSWDNKQAINTQCELVEDFSN